MQEGNRGQPQGARFRARRPGRVDCGGQQSSRVREKDEAPQAAPTTAKHRKVSHDAFKRRRRMTTGIPAVFFYAHMQDFYNYDTITKRTQNALYFYFILS